MKKLIVFTLVFFCLVMVKAENFQVLGNGSFEGVGAEVGPKWMGSGNFWKGKGICEVSSKEAFEGRQSLRCCLLESESRGQSSSDIFFLQPGQEYGVVYCMKRSSEKIEGRLSIEFTSEKGKGAFVCHATKGSSGKSVNNWHKIANEEINILFFDPSLKGRKYTVLKGGKFTLPVSAYGQKPVQCRGKLYMSGKGEIYFDSIAIFRNGGKENAVTDGNQK